MNTRQQFSLAFVLICSLASSLVAQILVPMPSSVNQTGDTYTYDATTRILYATRSGVPRVMEESLQPLAEVFAEELEMITGLKPAVVASASTTASATDIVLNFSAVSGTFAETEAEEDQSYTLDATASGVVIASQYYKGVAYGTSSLMQLLTEGTGGAFTVAGVDIDDTPVASYRTVMLDLARNIHSIDVIEDVVRAARMYRLRYVHLHLTDDQNFTFPFTPITDNLTGNFTYARQDLVDLVAYADARGVTLIPELDLPGHSTKVKDSGYLSPNDGNDFEVASAANYTKINMIVDDMLSVFLSSPYFHIGGDESGAGSNLEPFLAAVNEHLRDTPTGGKRRMLCWEGFGGAPVTELPPTGEDRVVVIGWEHRYNAPWNLLNAGYEVINASWGPMYVVSGWSGFVHPGIAASSKFPLTQMYEWNKDRFMHWDPSINVYQDLGPSDPVIGDGIWDAGYIGRANQVLGGQICCWEGGEEGIMHQLRPRLPILAERLWNPTTGDSYASFSARAAAVEERVLTIVQPVEILPFTPEEGSEPLEDLYVEYEGNSIEITMRNRTKLAGTIRYETGSGPSANLTTAIVFGTPPQPSGSSTSYTVPTDFSGGFNIRAKLFRSDGSPVGGDTWMRYNNYESRVKVTEYDVGRFPLTEVVDMEATYTSSDAFQTYNLPFLRGPLRHRERPRAQKFDTVFTAPGSGDYTFSLKTASGQATAYLDLNQDGDWDNGEAIIEDTPSSELPVLATVTLSAGQDYDLRIDHAAAFPRPAMIMTVLGPGISGTQDVSSFLSLPTGDTNEICLIGPNTNDGSFESRDGSGDLILGSGASATLGSSTTAGTSGVFGGIWTVTNGGAANNGGVRSGNSRQASDGNFGVFQNSTNGPTTVTTIASILGTNGYNTVSEGDVYEYSFDHNNPQDNNSPSTTELLISFNGGANFVSLATATNNDSDQNTFQTTSGNYTVTAANAAAASTGGLLVRMVVTDSGGNSRADNLVFCVQVQEGEPPSGDNVQTFKTLVILSDYTDQSVADGDAAFIQYMDDNMLETKDYWLRHSYGNIEIDYTTTEVFELPGVAADYDSLGSIESAGKAAAAAAGYVLADYDTFVFPIAEGAPISNIGGLASAGIMWMGGSRPFVSGLIHEYGHTLSLGHAGVIVGNTVNGSQVPYPGSFVDGRDGLVMMGSDNQWNGITRYPVPANEAGQAKADFSTINFPMRFKIGAVSEENYSTLEEDGIYRVSEYELDSLPESSQKLGLRFRHEQKSWWINFNPKYGDRWQDYGGAIFADSVVIRELSGEITRMLDMTPNSVAAGEEYIDSRDGGLQVGQSYTFPNEGPTITPIGTGVDAEGVRYMDLQVSGILEARSGLLVREEFDGYAVGSIVNQEAKGIGTTGNWTQSASNGSFELGAGLSGDNGLVIGSNGNNSVSVDLDVPEWGVGGLWMSYLYNESNYAGHAYVNSVGHSWSSFFAINNVTTPGGSSLGVDTYTGGVTYRIVTYFDFDLNTISMWADPVSEPVTGPTDPGYAPAAANSGVPPEAKFNLSFYSSGTIDDMRIGTTFASVVDDNPPGSNQYSTWAAENGASSDPSEDSNNNGTANGIEFFLGGTQAEPLEMPCAEFDGTNWIVTFPYDPTTNVDWKLQTSVDLATWGDWEEGSSEIQISSSPDEITFTLPDSSPDGRMFMRLAVTIP